MSFYDEVICADPRFATTDEVRDLALLEPGFRSAVKAVMADSLSVYGIELMVVETFRSKPRQKFLFTQKATKLEAVGVHHYGLAVDFAKLIGGKASWAGDWGFLRDLGVKRGLISGLDWGNPAIKHSFVDPDHLQACRLDQQEDLFAGNWYPEPVRGARPGIAT